MSRAGGTGNVHGASSTAGSSTVDWQWRAVRRLSRVVANSKQARRHLAESDSTRKGRHDGGAGRAASKPVQSSTHFHQLLHNVRYENTYKMGPPERLFEWPSVETMLSKLLVSMLRDHKYDAQCSARTAVDIANTARTRLKALAFPRYRYVVTATIGSMQPNELPSLLFGSKCLWNGVTDAFSSVTYVDDDETFYAVVVAFAVYLE